MEPIPGPRGRDLSRIDYREEGIAEDIPRHANTQTNLQSNPRLASKGGFV